MEELPRYLKVTVDKSHLITIGEKLYSESIELIRELVNNAYDADATEVRVSVTPEYIRVDDNGLGMNLRGLEQYFNIGSPEKRLHPKSQKFSRQMIGQFGIGKFATLSACQRFEVLTQHSDFAAKVVFDKEEWEKTGSEWHLPLETIPADSSRGDGTTVILSKLTKSFDPQEVERRLLEGVPIRAPNFAVYLNGRRLVSQRLPGHRLPVLEGTPYGIVHGEIVILPLSQSTTQNLGIECKVKGATIRRELFGMESWGKTVTRIRGEISADFLPITTDRTGFITDSPEYQAFLEVMRKVTEDIKVALGTIASKKERKKIRKALREAMDRVRKALAKNPQFAPLGMLPLGEENPAGGEPASTPSKRKAREEISLQKKKQGKRKRAPTVKRLTPNAVVQKVKMGEMGITCCLDYFGPDGPECFTEGTVIYINRDHPLYEHQARKTDTHTMHIARLLTQEISLLKDPRNPRQAFERQSKLLRDAFIEEDF